MTKSRNLLRHFKQNLKISSNLNGLFSMNEILKNQLDPSLFFFSLNEIKLRVQLSNIYWAQISLSLINMVLVHSALCTEVNKITVVEFYAAKILQGPFWSIYLLWKIYLWYFLACKRSFWAQMSLFDHHYFWSTLFYRIVLNLESLIKK